MGPVHAAAILEPLLDRLVELEVFAAVVGLGGPAAAARALELPPELVAARIEALEERLGLSLLHRLGAGASPTVDGLGVLRDVARILDDLRGPTELAADGPRGRVRVEVPGPWARPWLVPALSQLLARCPDLEIHLRSARATGDPPDGSVDCVIRAGEALGPGLEGRSSGPYELLTCAAPAYLAARGVPASPSALSEHVVVGLLPGSGGPVPDPTFTIDGRRVTVPARRRLACDDDDVALAAALAGAGLLQVPLSRRVVELLRTGRLVPVLDRWPAGELCFTVAWRRGDGSARVRALAEGLAALWAEEHRVVSSWRSAGYDGR